MAGRDPASTMNHCRLCTDPRVIVDSSIPLEVNSMSLEGAEQRLQDRLVVLPPSDRP